MVGGAKPGIRVPHECHGSRSSGHSKSRDHCRSSRKRFSSGKSLRHLLSHQGQHSTLSDQGFTLCPVPVGLNTSVTDCKRSWDQQFLLGDLELGVGPAGDIDSHVQDAIALVGKEGDVVKGGDDGSVLFRIDVVLW